MLQQLHKVSNNEYSTAPRQGQGINSSHQTPSSNTFFNFVEKIIGYRYRDGTDEYAYHGNYHWICSIMGGAEYVIHGKGFSPELRDNKILLEMDSHWLPATKTIQVPPSGKIFDQYYLRIFIRR